MKELREASLSAEDSGETSDHWPQTKEVLAPGNPWLPGWLTLLRGHLAKPKNMQG